jgi:hypothetical protein
MRASMTVRASASTSLAGTPEALSNVKSPPSRAAIALASALAAVKSPWATKATPRA